MQIFVKSKIGWIYIMWSKNIKKAMVKFRTKKSILTYICLYMTQSPMGMSSHHWYCNLAAVKRSVEASATARTEAAAVGWELFLACMYLKKKNHRGYKINWIIYPARRNSVKLHAWIIFFDENHWVHVVLQYLLPKLCIVHI